MVTTSSALATAGDADLSYGNGGVVVVVPGAGVTEIKATLLQPDGKLLLVGNCIGPSDTAANSFCMARLNADGSLDSNGFNPADPDVTKRGKVVFSPGAGSHTLANATLRADGRILVVGNCQVSSQVQQKPLCVAQFLRNGSIDTAFAANGVFRGPINGSDYPWATSTALRVAVRADDSLLIAASASSANTLSSYVIARLSASGAIDLTYGTQGVSIVGANIHDIADVVYLPSDQFVYVGRCDSYFTAVCAQRVNTSPATIDQTFGTAGLAAAAYVVNSASVSVWPQSAALQSDGAIVIGSVCGQSGPQFPCLSRLTANGARDTTFATPNYFAIARATDDVPTSGPRGIRSVAIQDDGRIVGAGQCAKLDPANVLNSINYRCVLRVMSDGTVDRSFGASDGVAYASPGGANPTTAGVAVSALGKLLISGSCSSTAAPNYCVTRLAGSAPCSMDVDGDGQTLALIDGLIVTRAMLGMTGDAILQGISLPGNARRNSWQQIRDYLTGQCGMTLAP